MYPEDLPLVRIDFVMIFIPITYRFLPIFTPIVNHFFVIWKQKFFFYFEQIFIDFRTDFIPIFTDLYVNFYFKSSFFSSNQFCINFHADCIPISTDQVDFWLHQLRATTLVVSFDDLMGDIWNPLACKRRLLLSESWNPIVKVFPWCPLDPWHEFLQRQRTLNICSENKSNVRCLSTGYHLGTCYD